MTTPVPPGYPPVQGYGPPQQAYGLPQQGYGPPNQGFGPNIPQQPGASWGPGPGPVPPAPRRRSRGKIVALVAALVVVALVVLGALFGSSSGTNVETPLQNALQGRPGITSVSDVNCPDNVDTDAGSTAVCQATINGQRSNLTLSFDKDKHFVVTDAVPAG
jgi:hypothetical protein